MDTHLTLLNEDVVREREAAMRLARERAHATHQRDFVATRTASITGLPVASRDLPGDAGAAPEDGDEHLHEDGHPVRFGADVLVLGLFAVLGSGFVALVVSAIRAG